VPSATDATSADVPVRAVDARRRFRWLVRVAMEVPKAQTEEFVDLCVQYGYGVRPDERRPESPSAEVRVLLVDVPMVGAKARVFTAAQNKATKDLGRPGVTFRARDTSLVQSKHHQTPTNLHIYRGFGGERRLPASRVRQRVVLLTGIRDTGSIAVYPGEDRSAENLVPEGHHLRLAYSFLQTDEQPAAPQPDAPSARRWKGTLVGAMIAALGAVAFCVIPAPQGESRMHYYLQLLFLLCIAAGCYQFVRDRASLAIVLAAVPIGISVLPWYTQLIAEEKIGQYLGKFGMSSAYMSYQPGTALEATLSPFLFAFATFGTAVAILGWFRYFMHTQHWIEWVFLFLALLVYALTAILTAGNEGQKDGQQAVVAAYSHGAVPDVYGYSPSVACVRPVSPSVAYEGASPPATGHATLVFGSSGGQTAVWDPRTGQTTLVSTDAVQIIPVDTLRKSCPQ
jgi:hypothetical protein